MVKITLYGGKNEIGGNKILLEDKGVRIFLDFGQSFNFGEDFFYDWLKPRTVNGLEAYFEFGLLPKLPKLYSKKMLALTDLKYEKPDVDAVFISHSHSDHCGHINFLDEDIPIYMGHGTHRIIEIYHKLYPGLVNIGVHNNLNFFKTGDKIKVKHLVIEPIHVEHSVPGAYGFIIHTSKGAVVYTGDFRMHGPRADMTKEFIKKAIAAKPHTLICEGTRMAYETEHNYTEVEVQDKADDIIKKSKGLVLTYFSMINVDRFMSFYRAAIKNKRILVIDPNFAYIIDNLRDKISILPDVMTDKNIRIYFRIAKSCTFHEKDYGLKERKYCPRMITYKEIHKDQKKYVMHMGFYKLIELIYLQPKNADFIYSMSEHFLEGEGNESERKIWTNWMEHFGITFHKAHCSGHASKKEVLDVVKRIGAEVVVPVHTMNEGEFGKVDG